MTKLSKRTFQIIKDHVADVLYHMYPTEVSTYNVAISIGRGRNIVKKALEELNKMGIVKEGILDKRGFKLIGNRRKWSLKWEYVRALKKKGF